MLKLARNFMLEKFRTRSGNTLIVNFPSLTLEISPNF